MGTALFQTLAVVSRDSACLGEPVVLGQGSDLPRSLWRYS